MILRITDLLTTLNLTLAFLFGLIIGGVSSSSSGGVLSLDLGVSLETSKS